MSNNNVERRKTATATILIGEKISDVINCFGKAIVGINMPLAFTGTKFTLLSSYTEDGTFQPVDDIFGNEVTIMANAGRNIESNGFLANKYYKLASDVNQGAEREIQVLLIGI